MVPLYTTTADMGVHTPFLFVVLTVVYRVAVGGINSLRWSEQRGSSCTKENPDRIMSRKVYRSCRVNRDKLEAVFSPPVRQLQEDECRGKCVRGARGSYKWCTLQDVCVSGCVTVTGEDLLRRSMVTQEDGTDRRIVRRSNGPQALVIADSRGAVAG